MPATTVFSSDGIQLSVRVTGVLDGPAVLLCDGIGCDGYIWRYIRPWLEKRCKVIHFHYRGHGQSEIPQDHSTLTIAQCGADAWTVLDACDVQSAVLIGHSMGVQVVLDAAHQAPERVRAVVAVCGAFERPLDTFQGSNLAGKVLPLLSGAFFRWPERLREVWQRALPTEFAYWVATATEINGRMIQRDDFLPYLRHMARMDPVVFMRFLESVAEHTSRPWLKQLTMPVLVVAGQKDNFTPMSCSLELIRLLPDAEICQVPGGSHTAPLELPELIELRLEDFARKQRLW